MQTPGYGSDVNGKSLCRYEVDVGCVTRAARMQQRRKRIDLKENDLPNNYKEPLAVGSSCKVDNRGAVPKEQADSALDGVRRRPTEPSYEDEEKIAKKEMYFKSSTIDFIVQGIPQTASETLMENSDKRSLFTDESAGSVGKYYAIVSAMVIRRNPPSLHRVTTLSDPDLSGATYDRNAVPEESHSSLGRMEEGR
ncbi:hypothetical protein L210DRAFT_3500508 [Boletus edulis BED1]|uniref:Uncharacterized protein n=1 Tax=Boletus edulis BED1 TaxID=1328754 RepID=A0AAD4C5E7_BOLED|nr:hypothetical protein L210DRAFT_3500508 [Boletus edulis BED1]